MGVDLRLLPHDPRAEFSQTIIPLNCRSELWGPIQELQEKWGRNVPLRFNTFLGRGQDGETGYGDTQETPYGEPLMRVPAGKLAELASHPCVRDDWENRAAWAYLKELPPDWWVALYWH